MNEPAQQIPFSTLAALVRDRVNREPEHSWLVGDATVFRKVCAAMDVIEDADLAIREYRALPDGRPVGYLAVYGVMQALILQQDGVGEIFTGVGLGDWDPKKTPCLALVREERNAATGHPTNRSKHPEPASFHIDRGSMSKSGFGLLGLLHDGGRTSGWVDVLGLIDRQGVHLCRVLENVLEAPWGCSAEE